MVLFLSQVIIKVLRSTDKPRWLVTIYNCVPLCTTNVYYCKRYVYDYAEVYTIQYRYYMYNASDFFYYCKRYTLNSTIWISKNLWKQHCGMNMVQRRGDGTLRWFDKPPVRKKNPMKNISYLYNTGIWKLSALQVI